MNRALSWALCVPVLGWLQLGGVGAPDLIVTDVDPSNLSVDCQTLVAGGTLQVTVENLGPGAAGGSTVLFFEDQNGNGTYEAGTDVFMGGTNVPPLAAGAQTTVAAFYAGPVTFNGNLIYAFADSTNVLAEADETNNYGNSGEDCLFMPQPGPFTMQEEWRWSTPPVGSPAPNHYQVMMTPAVVNLTDDNGDGNINDQDVPDVVFSCFVGSAYQNNSLLRAVSGSDGTQLWETPLGVGQSVRGEGSIAAGDIDGDGLPEILANGEPGNRLYVFEHDGTFKFQSDVIGEAMRWGGAALADLNQDGTPEIVFGRHVLDNTGAVLAVGTSRSGNNGVGPLSTVADVDRDGQPDIVAGFTVYDVIKDGGNNITGLSVKWEALNAAGGQVAGDGFPGVGNFDADDRAEVVVVSSGNVWLFDDDGTHLWGPVAIPGGGGGGAPNIDDFDNDGQPEVGTAGGSNYVVYETNGTVLWQSPTQDNSSNRTGSSVFDFEGDGSAEVIYKDELFLRVYRGTDGFVLAQVATGSGTTYENPVIVDVDRDGNAEIVVCANDYAFGSVHGIQAFGDPSDQWVNTRRIWNQHTYHIANVADDATIPAVETDNWLTFNNFRSQEAGDVGDIFGAPNLTASFIRIDDTNCPDEIGLTVRVGNGGANVAAAPVDVAFYVDGPLAGVVQTTVNLNPGEYEDVTLFVPALQGVHTVCAVVDDDGTGVGAVSECIETDNQCCTDIDLTCPECFLVLGNAPGISTFTPFDHTFVTQVDEVVEYHAVLLNDIPDFPLVWTTPSGPLGSSLLHDRSDPFAVQSFHVQVVMWNPEAFPDQPEQWTGGLSVFVLPGGRIFSRPYGDGTGMEVWAEIERDGQGDPVIRFPFSIPGF